MATTKRTTTRMATATEPEGQIWAIDSGLPDETLKTVLLDLPWEYTSFGLIIWLLVLVAAIGFLVAFLKG